MKMKNEERTETTVMTPALTPISATTSTRAQRTSRIRKDVLESSLPLRICV